MLANSITAFAQLAVLAAVARAGHHEVAVGKDKQLKFVPETLNAAIGDTITYSFFAKDPCHPLEGGFFSGFVPTASETEASPTTWTITVKDSKPIWIYCGQTTGNHCQSGMVHAVNAPATGNTFDAYKSKAATASTSTSPADGLPAGGSRVVHITVALDKSLTFSPNDITEPVGTVVEFAFNPANHTVTQSSFDDPCHPLANGFSSGFIPTSVSPSGVLFDIVVKDTKPIWFYCGQPNKNHCQSGMVGSVNAPASGNTLQAFTDKAKGAAASTIPPQAPLGGTLIVNGTVIPTLNGNVLNVTALDSGMLKDIPPPGQALPPLVGGMAGGGPPNSYNWAPQISDNSTAALQLLQFLDNVLLEVLFEGFLKVRAGGEWAGVYPRSIVDTLGALAAQALVHRSTATDSLQHYKRDLMGACTHRLPSGNGTTTSTGAEAFIDAALALVLVEIGALTDAVTVAAVSGDQWLVPALATQIGAKSRMAGVLEMMRGRAPGAAPREALLPAGLAYSFVASNYVSKCPDGDAAEKKWGKALPALQVSGSRRTMPGGRKASITVAVPEGAKGDMWVAWVGAWGSLRFTSVQVDGGQGTADVPADLGGHVWSVLVTKKDVKAQELAGVAVAGPSLVWVSESREM
ncbi:uncharacterized protein E0L32_000413 [Thyridium curvatum]|uniref:Uncharacterized protein n=1 Tax=Thyridium curvatum TaxID=1093900 RepID=A0A507B9E7_9PEZI|nr:uncharacterized protein E0L32_000413 [Thyridium curvatum]TPX14019.1 hypothetical protein E0L32_000413 [Thyridium curvatum]